MTNPLFELEEAYIRGLKSGTDKNIDEWFTLIERCGLNDKKSIRDWLITEQDLHFMDAFKIANLFIEDRRWNEARVKFHIHGRSGEVEYKSKLGHFKMDWGMGITGIIAVVEIPPVDRWEKITTIPISKRLAVLHFIGKKIVEQETRGLGSYEINKTTINIKS